MKFSAFVFFLFSGITWATPSISVITGTTSLVQGGTITISGTNFTSYSTTTGTFDTFENGSISPYWAFSGMDVTNTLPQRNAFSIYNANHTATGPSDDDMGFQGAGVNRRSWYISFWWKVASDWHWGRGTFGAADEWLSNIKMIRMWNSGAFLENVYMAWEGFNGSLGLLEEALGAGANHLLHINETQLTLNTWHEFRFQFVDSSAAGVSDGSLKIWLDTATIYDVTGQLYKEDENVDKRPQRIGFQNEWGCHDGAIDGSGPCPNATAIMDNVYAYDTLARVEICDTPIYTSCLAYPEIQPIRSWTNTDITVNYNEGSLSPGTTQYVFVVDNAGVPSAGFALTGGSGGGGGGGGTPGLHGHSGMNGHGVLK
jgi:hypothetical protein